MRLSTQLITIMIAAVVISLLAAGYFSFTATKSVLEQSIGENQLELAKETMNKIDRVLNQKLQEIQVIAETEASEELLGLLLKEEAISTEAAEANREILQEHQFLTGPWDIISLYDWNGILITSTMGSGNGLEESPEQQAAFKAALNGQVYHSDLVLSGTTNKPTIVFSAPVRSEREHGRPVIGAIVAEFSWPVIIEILDEVSVLDRNVHLFNKNGKTIGTPAIHRGEILKRDLQNIPTVQEALEGKCSSSIGEDHYQRGDIHNLKNTPSLNSCALQQGYLGYKGNGWGLIVETSQSRIFAPVQKLAKTFLLASLSIALLITPIIFILSRSITGPIKKLKESADKISKGFFGEPIEVRGKTEISELAESLDNMRYSLKLVIDEYEKMKGKEELQKNLQILEKKQEETIKNLRIAIAEQKIAQSAEQKALKNYRVMEEKLEHLSKFPEENLNIVLKIGNLGKIKYSNAAAKNYAKSLNVSIKSLLPGNYKGIVKKLHGSKKAMQVNYKIKGKSFIYSFAGMKNGKYVLVTGVEVKG